jgi:two-component system, response regulator YesN
MAETIRALIVDDEKLVRQGMIAIMPWKEHNIEVAGDVNSGEKALEFLQRHKINLLITDLAMPVMSGLELIRKVKALYPDIWIVVLTFHQDFDLVQEALRLGVIDYILKTQLEKEQMSDVLARIVSRIENDNKLIKTMVGAPMDEVIRNDNALLLITGSPGVSLQAFNNEAMLSKFAVREVDGGMLLLEGHDVEKAGGAAASALIKSFPGSVVVKVRNVRGQDRKALLKFLAAYGKTQFFFDYSKGCDIYNVEPADMHLPEPVPASVDGDLAVKWSSFQWVYDSEAFETLLLLTESLRLEPARLANALLSSRKEWERTLALINSEYSIEQPENMQYWCDWKQWLKGTRAFLQQKTQKDAYSSDIAASIMKALDIINRADEPDIKQERVARQVCMSRSYFSQCFKDIIGKSFNDYVRSVKIEKAKVLLAQTNRPIYWIADQIGYMDEKHFSRVFHEQTGLLPTEFRSRMR